MKNIGLKVKAKLADTLSNNMSPLSVEKATNSKEETSINNIGIVPKSMYLSMDRRYKVISKKELLAIVENEKQLRSPFAQSYVLYRVKNVGEGEWSVKFYFIDTQAHPEILKTKMLLIWEDIVAFLLKKQNTNSLQINSCWGKESARLNAEKVHLSGANSQSLKNKILAVEGDPHSDTLVLDEAALKTLTVEYLLSFVWWDVLGTFNKQGFNQTASPQFLRQINYRFLGYVLLGAVVLESGFLLASTHYLDSQIESNAELRQTYSQLKRQYNGLLERYSHMVAVESKRSHLAQLPALLGGIDEKAGLRIDRLDYMEGEVRIGGLIDDVDLLVGYLSEQKKVQQLEFVSPIKPDKSGKDRFVIKFEFLND